MWRTTKPLIFSFFVSSILKRYYSTTSNQEIPSLYSFLQPSLFKQLNSPNHTSTKTPTPTKTLILTHQQKTSLEISIQYSITNNETDEAWKSFKILTTNATLPTKHLSNSLITHLSSRRDSLNLKRAFASAVYLMQKNPENVTHDTVKILLSDIRDGGTPSPAFALVREMFKNRFYVPFTVWGDVLVDISRRIGSLGSGFLPVFNENCRICWEEKLKFMKPGINGCNAALEGCCFDLESVRDAESIVEMMSVLGVRPDELSFGFLGYLYAVKGMEGKITELRGLMEKFEFKSRWVFFSKLISGYVKAGRLESVLEIIMRSLKEGNGDSLSFGEESYKEIVKGFFEYGNAKLLVKLIIQAQMLECPSIETEKSVGFGVINACINLGLLDKVHNVLNEMKAEGGSVGIGVYFSILKAYHKEYRTVEAAQMVMEINDNGLQLDAVTYDGLIDASMTNQDFQSAFSLFRSMREARVSELQVSYLTIMTGLTENHRPELMASFLDEVVEDPHVKVGTHDWNSIIHAFCKSGRMDDARRTFRRMVFLQCEPNDQTYLSLINGYVTAEDFFSVLILWTEVRKRVSVANGKTALQLNHGVVDAFLYALVKGGFFDAVMQIAGKAQEMKIHVDKWRYKQAFMETHKKLRVARLRKRNIKKMDALVAFKNWAGLSS